MAHWRRLYLALFDRGSLTSCLHAAAARPQRLSEKADRIIRAVRGRRGIPSISSPRVIGRQSFPNHVGQSDVIDEPRRVGRMPGGGIGREIASDGIHHPQEHNGQAIAPALYRSMPRRYAEGFIRT